MPLVPHLSEELWEMLGKKNFVSLEKWPEVDKKLIDKKVIEAENMIDNSIDDIKNILKVVKAKAKKVCLYTIPADTDLFNQSKDFLENEFGLKIEIYAVNDPKKYDPQDRAKRTKKGKPAIYVE